MRQTVKMTLLGGLTGLMTLWVACPYPERNVQAFDPNTELGHTTGLVHVQPSPIHLRKALLPQGGNCRIVEIANIGTEPFRISRIGLEGSHMLSQSFLGQMPLTMEPGWLHGFHVCSDDSVDEPREGFLVLETDDPGGPVVRVPILADADPFVEPPDPFRPYLRLSPNPVRVGESTEGDRVTVSLLCERCDEQRWLRLDEAESTGTLVEIDAIRSLVSPGGTLSLPAKLTQGPSDDGHCAMDLRVVAPEPTGLSDTLTLMVTNWLGERYQIDLQVLTN
jgi:hypothetical protein